MPARAEIKSVDAVEGFRQRLIRYLEKATAVLDEVHSEVRGTLVWLEDRQKPYWEHQVRSRARALEDAQHEIFGARLSQFKEANDAQQMAVHRAKRRPREAEEKLRRVKVWVRRYQSDVEPLAREVEKLRTALSQDLKKGARHLERILRSLEGYTTSRVAVDQGTTSGDATVEARSEFDGRDEAMESSERSGNG